MSIGTLEILDFETVTSRYRELAARVGDLSAFKARGRAYDLDAAEAALYDEIRDLEFLLDGE